MWSFLSWARNLPAERRRLWTIGASVLVGGAAFKTLYFGASRGMLVDGMDETHRKATAHLKEAQEFAIWSHKDREERVPTLTPEQDEQLRNYLALVVENSPMAYPPDGEGKELAEIHQARKQESRRK